MASTELATVVGVNAQLVPRRKQRSDVRRRHTIGKIERKGVRTANQGSAVHDLSSLTTAAAIARNPLEPFELHDRSSPALIVVSGNVDHTPIPSATNTRLARCFRRRVERMGRGMQHCRNHPGPTPAFDRCCRVDRSAHRSPHGRHLDELVDGIGAVATKCCAQLPPSLPQRCLECWGHPPLKVDREVQAFGASPVVTELEIRPAVSLSDGGRARSVDADQRNTHVPGAASRLDEQVTNHSPDHALGIPHHVANNEGDSTRRGPG